jgi:hypothetical protein
MTNLEDQASLDDVSRLARAKAYARTNWLALFSAFVIGLGLPLWKILVVERPSLHVEVTGLDVSAPEAALNLDTAGLRDVAEVIQGETFGEQSEIKADHVTRILAQRKTRLAKVTEQRAATKSKFAELEKKKASLTVQDVREFGSNLSQLWLLRDLPAMIGTSTGPLPEDKKNIVLASITKKMEDDETSLAKDVKLVEDAIAQFEQYKAKAQTDAANVRVECAVSNSGGGAISLKPQGLIRVSLGGSNYLDVQLRVQQYETLGDLAPKTSKIIRLASDPLQKLGGDERERVINYFKQSAPAELYLIDIRGNSYHSDVVPFAKGLYDQSAYDSLRVAAGDRNKSTFLGSMFSSR